MLKMQRTSDGFSWGAAAARAKAAAAALSRTLVFALVLAPPPPPPPAAAGGGVDVLFADFLLLNKPWKKAVMAAIGPSPRVPVLLFLVPNLRPFFFKTIAAVIPPTMMMMGARFLQFGPLFSCGGDSCLPVGGPPLSLLLSCTSFENPIAKINRNLSKRKIEME